MRSGLGELITEIAEVDNQQETVPLGTAQWMGLVEAAHKLSVPDGDVSGRVLMGAALNDNSISFGYGDDRHVLVVSGTRGGKGTGAIVPNLCLWPGSCVIVDPKGENAQITARRRGNGSDYTRGLGQDIKILDPFDEVRLPSDLKARFNPLDVIDINSDYAVDDASRIAGAIIVQENRTDPYWENAARALLEGLILHVVSWPAFEGMRNLITVRRLLMEGDWIGITAAQAQGVAAKDLPSSHGMLWEGMRCNKAFGGVVAGGGEQMVSMSKHGDKAYSGVLETARTCTKFLDSPPMRRVLETSDFDLGAIKTSPRGLSIYLTLPQRLMETHFRWLRLMVTLTIGEMERIKGRPQSGYPTLFVLDEFAGLKKMEVILNAVAQSAGVGLKFAFIVQSLAQLREEYGNGWEIFLGNSGLKLFWQIDDHFSRDYLSKLMGEREVTRQSRSGSDSQSTSTTDGKSSTSTRGSTDSTSYSNLHKPLFGLMSERGDKSISQGYSESDSSGWSRSTSDSKSTTAGWAEGVHKRPLLSPDEIGRFLSRIDDKNDPAYPGILVALLPGQHPVAARRINYFRSPKFEGCFDPHPDHPPPLTLAELAIRDANRRAKKLQEPKPDPKPKAAPRHVGFWEELWDNLKVVWFILTDSHPAIGGAVALGIVALLGLAFWGFGSSSLTIGPAVVANAPQLNIRSCAAANCRVIDTLDKGDPVTVTKLVENGWAAITVKFDNGKVERGFVNGDFLRAQ